MSLFTHKQIDKKINEKDKFEKVFPKQGIYEVYDMTPVGRTSVLKMQDKQGALLADCPINEQTYMILTGRIHTLFRSLQFYRKAHDGREYPYLSPCTILVAGDGMFLLTLEDLAGRRIIQRLQETDIRREYFHTVCALRLRGAQAQLYRLRLLLDDLARRAEPFLTRKQKRRWKDMMLRLESGAEADDPYKALEEWVHAAFGGSQ